MYTQFLQDGLTEIFNKTGSFFAFSDAQFEKNKNPELPHTEYYAMGSGLYCPKKNIDIFHSQYDQLIAENKKKVLGIYTKEQIILEELLNHECFYTGDYSDILEIMEGYDITEEEVKAVFKKHRSTY